MATGISVTRSALAEFEGTDLVSQISEVIVEEVSKTKNPIFGRADLGELKARLMQATISRVLAIIVKQKGAIQ